MKNILKAFLISFIQIGLIAGQIKLVQENAYIAIFLISIGISLCWFFNVHIAIGNNRLAKLGYILGAACGVVSITYILNLILGK